VKRRSCLALTALLTALPPAQATPAGPGLFGFTENLPPLNYLDASGPQGFSVELLRLMADTAGLPLALEVLPWQRALQQAESQAGPSSNGWARSRHDVCCSTSSPAAPSCG
jgi:polar amino acid transport system substrate-binding protein